MVALAWKVMLVIFSLLLFIMLESFFRRSRQGFSLEGLHAKSFWVEAGRTGGQIG